VLVLQLPRRSLVLLGKPWQQRALMLAGLSLEGLRAEWASARWH
jgi:hypothetical protein